ncbi:MULTISPECIES: giguanylate cyclase [unclassified Rhodococcus (in: high G+C Gram-positive bacteria)]|uniref:giguanylate cyclase n=1 Tax=unclassified Rhodococcus (in: high G+C Gram-positive bacteria) TaxID=192944 RepID=UPI000B9B6E4B|nr:MULTISPECIES: giguanylate cyclase [unclassified Rhodococcus (in: high G+C Gram-positive bacteria)]MBY4228329.1 giguanylate cyclase [Rhodococcus fascians]MDI9929745.1 giguanylate cyclase [Rhodococcus sp. IEGM 1354]OZD60664.1 giguanylate cyclase [Rhodococcus sp. 06-1460-1B]
MTRALTRSNEHYQWGMGVMTSLAVTTLVKRIVSAAALAMAVVVTLELAFGYGATTPIPSIVQWTCMIAAYVMGAFWWFGPWPTLGQAFAFVVIADLSIFGATITANFAPEVTLGKCTFLIPMGMLAGFFFDKWRLAAHIALCLLGTSIVAVYIVLERDVDTFVAVVLWAPIVVTLTGFVLMLQLTTQSIRTEFE